MKGLRFTFCALAILASLMLLTPKPALPAFTSGNQAGGVDFFDAIVDPTASGAKMVGTLSILFPYAGQGNCGAASDVPVYNMIYTLRVIKGSTPLGFSSSYNGTLCLTETGKIADEIDTFVNGIVIQKLYPTLPNNPSPVATLKGVTNDIGPQPAAAGEEYCCYDSGGNPMNWIILDLEYAVK